ncbi:MAG TPA: Dabb family protein [Oscillatoriaceae cyanobacterium M33_DOE_052]|uniref:Dabb family protein n=1 Tax=Planktothricoides sp. SpSt-374 TaxID=2282167 RepID=A0A7C3ZNV3_9CYAN|nr:Dabb family protein [Oscillatoriaceae cyanobacterium M33_DOE_052]
MIKHIVMWRLKDEAAGFSMEENASQIKEMLENLKGVIPEILHLEVGMNVLASPAAYEVALYSEFASLEALAAYQRHPEHEKCKEFIGQITKERAVVDYEV